MLKVALAALASWWQRRGISTTIWGASEFVSVDESTGFWRVRDGHECTWRNSTAYGMGEPDVAVITSIGEAHLEGVGSLKGVAKAKGEIFET